MEDEKHEYIVTCLKLSENEYRVRLYQDDDWVASSRCISKNEAMAEIEYLKRIYHPSEIVKLN